MTGQDEDEVDLYVQGPSPEGDQLVPVVERMRADCRSVLALQETQRNADQVLAASAGTESVGLHRSPVIGDTS